MRFVALFLASLAAAQVQNGTVYYLDGEFQYAPNTYDTSGVAYGSFLDYTHTKSAFGSLSISTNPTFNDTMQMYGAGYLEGALTQSRIKQQFDNIHAWLMNNFPGQPDIPKVFVDFFEDQDKWAHQMVATNASAFWVNFGSILSQFDGLVAGYNSAAPTSDKLTEFDLQQINAIGDFFDLIPALTPGKAHDWDSMTPEEVMQRVHRTTHCSALVKVTGNYSDMFFGHVAWFTYISTNRIFKHYNFPLHHPAVAGQQMSFASYPGYLSSLDDYYTVWSSGLAVLETTNSIFNMSLYQYVQPQSLFAWHRVRLANLLARGGQDWYTTFASYNSGTYNNQYDVVNVGAWTPGAALRDDTLWVVEQIPGMVVGGDVTQQLERGYFPSYNVPYWPQIYNASGYVYMLEKHGLSKLTPGGLGDLAGIEYQMAPRAQIFRRDQGKVVDLSSFTAMLRYNDYKNDPYSKGSPWNAICSRGDLASVPSPDGCYDGKASQATWWSQKKSVAINGPTVGDGSLPPFSWSQFPSAPQEGLPYTYSFQFEEQTPSW